MTGIIILAAGSSSRMGTAKQNLVFKGQTLLQNAIKTTRASKADCVIIVLGANAHVIIETLKKEPLHIIINKDWKAGMGSSISYGLRELLNLQPEISSVLFMVVDQPFVKADFIDSLIDQASPGKIIASGYSNTVGPPVLFDRFFFDVLLKIKGNDGAKKIIQKNQHAVIKIAFDLGAFDIDTPEDYQRLID